MPQPKIDEHWVVQLHDRDNEVVLVALDKVYPCGDEQGWPLSAVTKWVRKIRLH